MRRLIRPHAPAVMIPPALDRRLEPGADRPMALALSGGGDSVALLLLASLWARARGRRLLALTVDHGLHPDSAAWTAEAGRLARGLGVAWRPLRWRGAAAAAGLPAAARRARHVLLADAAREAGACALLMAHTADDVAESELIRKETPTHGRLAEWAPSPVWPEGRGVFLLRPLLGVRRAELRQALEVAGLPWLEDPANADLRFARARARAALAAGGGGSYAAAPRPQTPSEAWADAAGCVHLPRGASAGLLAKAVLCAAGGERPPRGEAVARLMERLRRGEDVRVTLGGARVTAIAGAVRLVRDAGERRGAHRQEAASAERTAEERRRTRARALFDGRFEVAAPAGWRTTLLAGLAARLPREDGAGLRAVATEARPALPALIASDGRVRLPGPFGEGPGYAAALAPRRLDAACGRISGEAEAAHDLARCVGVSG